MCFIICYLTFSERAARKQISVRFFYMFQFRVGTANKCNVDPKTWKSKVHLTIRTWIQNDSYASKNHEWKKSLHPAQNPKLKQSPWICLVCHPSKAKIHVSLGNKGTLKREKNQTHCNFIDGVDSIITTEVNILHYYMSLSTAADVLKLFNGLLNFLDIVRVSQFCSDLMVCKVVKQRFDHMMVSCGQKSEAPLNREGHHDCTEVFWGSPPAAPFSYFGLSLTTWGFALDKIEVPSNCQAATAAPATCRAVPCPVEPLHGG